MAQSLQIDIKTTSDVPQAMDRAKAATVGFGKQVEDIKKKFGTSFKDIFLSFLGPMALVALAMQSITKLIADERQKREDANRAAIDGTNKLMSAEDVYYARRVDNIRKTRLAAEQAKAQPEETAKQFLLNDPRFQEVLGNRRYLPTGVKQFGADARDQLAEMYAKDPRVQDAVRRMLKGDIEKENLTSAGSALPNSTPFKAPEGFSNVVGVGANPVLDAMTSQLAEAKRTNDLLTQIAQGGGGRTSTWLTAADSPAPSRAVMLQGK